MQQPAQDRKLSRQLAEGRVEAAAGPGAQPLPPAAHGCEVRLEGLHQLCGPAPAAHQLPDGGVEPHGILEAAQVALGLHLGRAPQQGHHIHTGRRHGQQPRRGQYPEAVRRVLWQREGLPALLLGHVPQQALLPVGDGVDPALGLGGAEAALEHPAQVPEGHGAFQIIPGPGDDAQGKIPSLQQPGQLVPAPGGQVRPGPQEHGVALAAPQVPVHALQQLDHRPGTQTGAVGADHHQGVGILPDPVGRGQQAHMLSGGGAVRQLHPACVRDRHVGGGQLRLDPQKIRQAQHAPNIGNIDLDHRLSALPSCCMCKCYRNCAPNARGNRKFFHRSCVDL